MEIYFISQRGESNMDTDELRRKIQALNLTPSQLRSFAPGTDEDCVQACEDKYESGSVELHNCCLDCYNHAALESIGRKNGIS